MGKSLKNFDMIEDQKEILDQILDIAQERQCDAIVIAGDIYDKKIPSEAAVNLFDAFLRKAVDRALQVYAISGNHDSDERLNFGASLFERTGVYVAGKYDGELYCRQFQDEYGEVNLYLLPFVAAGWVRYYHSDAVIETYEDAVREVIRRAQIDTTKRNVFVAHQYVAGRSTNHELQDPRTAGSENVATIYVGNVEKIGSDCFDGLDYVALGHIHTAQQVGRREVRYAGSPLKYSVSEEMDEKSVPVVTLGPKGTVEIELVELEPKRNLRVIRGRLRDLIRHVEDPEDYIHAVLYDERPIADAMSTLQAHYPRALDLEYRNESETVRDSTEPEPSVGERPFSEIIMSFYQQMYGSEMTPEELEYMMNCAREAGIDDEAM